MSSGRWMDKEYVVHICNGILLSHKKEQNWVICKDMDRDSSLLSCSHSNVSSWEKPSLPTHFNIQNTPLPKFITFSPFIQLNFSSGPLIPCCILYLYCLIGSLFLPLKLKFHKSRNQGFLQHLLQNLPDPQRGLNNESLLDSTGWLFKYVFIDCTGS